jgi:hypothetical protein
MNDLKWDNLFDYLEVKVNFHKVKGKTTWTCDNQLTFTKEFCDINNLDFEKVKSTLNTFGGYCDCEVLFNAQDHLTDRYIFAEILAINHKEETQKEEIKQ